MLASLLYSLLQALLDVLATRRGDQAQLQAEVLALRRQVQVLERQIKRVRWTPGDRMLMAAFRDRLAKSAWAGLLVRPEDRTQLASSLGASQMGRLPQPIAT